MLHHNWRIRVAPLVLTLVKVELDRCKDRTEVDTLQNPDFSWNLDGSDSSSVRSDEGRSGRTDGKVYEVIEVDAPAERWPGSFVQQDPNGPSPPTPSVDNPDLLKNIPFLGTNAFLTLA